MSRLSIAAGNTKNTANTRKPNRKSTKLPIITRPRTMPIMKAKDPSIATHGNKPTQAAKKAGDNKTTALSRTNVAVTNSNAAGIKYLNGK